MQSLIHCACHSINRADWVCRVGCHLFQHLTLPLNSCVTLDQAPNMFELFLIWKTEMTLNS